MPTRISGAPVDFGSQAADPPWAGPALSSTSPPVSPLPFLAAVALCLGSAFSNGPLNHPSMWALSDTAETCWYLPTNASVFCLAI